MPCDYFLENSCSIDSAPVSSDYAEEYCLGVCFDSCHKYVKLHHAAQSRRNTPPRTTTHLLSTALKLGEIDKSELPKNLDDLSERLTPEQIDIDARHH